MRRALALALVFTLIAVAGTAVNIEASAPDSYTVQDGDTLLSIAAKVGIPADQQFDWVNSTVALNGLADADSLKLGQSLKLPSASSSTTASAGSSSGAAAKATSATVSSTTYTVKDGDTLWGIAGKLGVPASDQAKWVETVQTMNGMDSGDSLSLGQTLTVPSQAPATSSSASTVSATTNPTAPATSTTSTTSSPSTTTSTSLTATSAGSVTTGLNGSASSYGDSFTGKSMGCTGAGPYSPSDTTIIAVGPAMYTQFPCGTPIEVCGPKGCITGIRKDACPGCEAYHVDLSKAGLAAVCGPSSCAVRVRRLS